MSNKFLVQDSIRANSKKKKLFLTFLIVFIIMLCVLIFAGLFDFNDEKSKKLGVAVAGLSVVMAAVSSIGLIKACCVAKNGENLILPFNEAAKDVVAETINNDIENNRVLVDELDDVYPENKQPYVQRIMLLPTYLLLFNGMGKITAIPRNKIYWVCPQYGIKGRSSFVARLIVFTETRAFYFECFETITTIADKLYEHIPNYFSGDDSFMLSYKLEEIYNSNRAEFVRIITEKTNENSV